MKCLAKFATYVKIFRIACRCTLSYLKNESTFLKIPFAIGGGGKWNKVIRFWDTEVNSFRFNGHSTFQICVLELAGGVSWEALITPVTLVWYQFSNSTNVRRENWHYTSVYGFVVEVDHFQMLWVTKFMTCQRNTIQSGK